MIHHPNGGALVSTCGAIFDVTAIRVLVRLKWHEAYYWLRATVFDIMSRPTPKSATAKRHQHDGAAGKHTERQGGYWQRL